MNDDAPAEWVASWFEYHRLSSGSRRERKALSEGRPPEVFAAYDWVDERITDGGETALGVLEQLADSAASLPQLSMVGITGIEQLIYEHRDAVVRPLIARARRSPNLARALKSVSLADDSISDASLRELQEFARWA